MQTISGYYQVPVWELDNKMISEVTDSIVKNESIKSIQITDEIGRVIYEKSSQGESFNELRDGQSLFYESTKILYPKDNYIGDIHVLFSDDKVLSENQSMFVTMMGVVLLFSVFMALGVYYFLVKYLKKPLDVLLKAIKSASGTQYEVRIHQKFPAELGILAEEFNKAMIKIQTDEQALLNHNLNLEKLVEERTKEVDLQRAQMINSSRLAALGEFVAGVAHEINNPLTVISGNARVLDRSVKNGKIMAEFQNQIDKILSMSDRISKIIKNMRSYARDGKSDPMAYFNLNKFLDDILMLTKIKLDQNGIRLEYQNHTNIDEVYGQEIPLSQVIINVINNAADAIEQSDDKWIRFEVIGVNKEIHFIITDSGTGIPISVQEKMMNPFFTTKEIGKGTGLGLSIAANIVKGHYGELIYNKDSLNTQFIIKLPVDR
ncbi:MAG: GHKL domain-containing protein, partial [Bdellovibrionales bacterium]|nr:GHKL domain-containing protein [Bdellovibrionales bacterium]